MLLSLSLNLSYWHTILTDGAFSGVTVTIVLLLLAIIAQTVTWPRTATG